MDDSSLVAASISVALVIEGKSLNRDLLWVKAELRSDFVDREFVVIDSAFGSTNPEWRIR
jgi:hypothetical protein